MVFEFEDFVIVGEVTLLGSSRQEAAEGEPVRRHVAELALRYGKPVYGLFVAPTVDTNTVETFRHGTWFTANDDRLDLDIVPLTLPQFADVFVLAFKDPQRSPQAVVRAVLDACIAAKPADAPEWRREISTYVETEVQRLR